MAKFESKYGINQEVYLSTGDERDKVWIVRSITFVPGGQAVYTVVRGTFLLQCHDIELCSNPVRTL